MPTPHKQKTINVCIDGMTCHSCEVLIERKLKDMPGVHQVNVNANKGTARIECEESCTITTSQLEKAIADNKYRVREWSDQEIKAACDDRPSPLRLVGVFLLVFLVATLFDTFGVFGSTMSVTKAVTFSAAIVLGLVAGTSSCLAVAGGLLLSSAAKFNERYRNAGANDRMRPVLFFVFGRIIAYGFFGGLIGLLGQAFTFSPVFTGGLIIFAAVYMITMGLDMLKISPKWLKACMPRIPKSLSHKIMDANGKEHWSAPFLLGGATFFLPCGFTQALQVYALTTGSFWQSAFMLSGFAVGTAPALLALGFASSSLKGKAGTFFFQFSGALVIILGIWNIQNGLALAGVTAPDFTREPVTKTDRVNGNVNDPNVKLVNGVQTIQMKLLGTDPYYSPSDTFTVKAGVPVQMTVNGVGQGCRSMFQIPKLGVSTYLDKQKNSVSFTPKKPGKYVFSCGMGMYRGTLNVISSS